MSKVTKTINGVCYESSGHTGVRAAIGDYILVTTTFWASGYARGDVLRAVSRHTRLNTPLERGVMCERLNGSHVDICLVPEEYEILKPVADTVCIDGVSYRKVKRHARVGERIQIVSADCTFGDYRNGDVFTVAESGTGCIRVQPYKPNGVRLMFDAEYVVLEPLAATTTPSTDCRITTLESEVAALKTRVATLESANVPAKYTTNVPQPEGKRVGDIVHYVGLSTGPQDLTIAPNGQYCSVDSGTCQLGSWAATGGKLVDDSARYTS